MKQTGRQSLAVLAIPALLGLFLVLSSGIDLVPALGTYNGKRVIQIGIFLAALLVGLGSSAIRHSLADLIRSMPGWMGISLVLVIALGIVSALRFQHPGYSLAEVGMLSLVLLVTMVVAACRDAAGRNFDRLSMMFVFCLVSVVTLQEYIGMLGIWFAGGEYSYELMLIRFAHPRFYNQLQTWTLPVLAAMPFLFRSRNLKWITVALIGLQWCLLWISGGRGSFISILFGLVLAAILVPGQRARVMRIHGIGFLLGAGLYLAMAAGHLSAGEEQGQFLDQSSGRPLMHTTGRSYYWKLAWADMLKHPILGSGPARFACDGPENLPASAHNFFLSILGEWGIPAATLLLVIVLFAAYKLTGFLRSLSGNQPEDRILQVLLFAAVTGAALHTCVSGLLGTPASQVAAAWIGGWLWGSAPYGRRGNRMMRQVAATVLALGVLASVVTGWFALHEIPQYELRTEKLQQKLPAYPRFWQYGKICLYSYN